MQDYHPDPESFWKPRSRVRRSKPAQAMAADGPVFAVPPNTAAIPITPSQGSENFFSTDAPRGGLGVQVGEIKVTNDEDHEDIVVLGDEKDESPSV